MPDAVKAISPEEFNRLYGRGGPAPAAAPAGRTLTFTVKGRARGLARPKATRMGTLGVRMYDPKSNVTAKAEVARAFTEAARCIAVPLQAPVRLTVIASYHTPRKKLWGTAKLTRPDSDNCAKLALDGLQGLAYRDDSQVYRVECEKRWAAESSFTISLEWEEIPQS